MSSTFNIYCDESCHLENDHQPVMVLGAVWCPLDKTREISQRIREIKGRHGLPATFEVKWSKVSPSKQAFYLDLLDYFFDDDDLHFRALIVADKTELQHATFARERDDWYYKMYFDTLKLLLSPDGRYRIYLDIKDTVGARKVENLREVLCNNMYDFERKIIERIQTVRSHEVEQVQLTDLLAGIIGYANRGANTSAAKVRLVNRMRERSGYSLERTTLLREQKVNLFQWKPSESRA